MKNKEKKNDNVGSSLKKCTPPELKVYLIQFYKFWLFSVLISLANAETAIYASFPVDKISDGGKMNPYFPVSLNSIV